MCLVNRISPTFQVHIRCHRNLLVNYKKISPLNCQFPETVRAVFISILVLGMCSLVLGQQRIVNYWHVGISDEVKFLEEQADIFLNQTGIEVHVQPVPWGNFQTKYLTAMASGMPPDAGATSLGGPVEYGKVGGVLDIEQEYPEVVARIKDRIFPKMWASCYFRGHLFGIPYNATPLMGYYRTDVFERLNIEPPETWTDLTDVIDVLNANDYSYGYLWTRNAHWGLGTYVWPFDELTYGESGTDVNWLAPGFIKGYSYAIQLWNDHNMGIEKPVELFMLDEPRSSMPMFIDYDFRYSEILMRAPELKDKMGIFPFPSADDGKPSTIMGGRTMVIFREAQNPDDAILWLEFLTSLPVQLAKLKFMNNLGERSYLDLSVNIDFWKEDLGLIAGHQEVLHQIFLRMETKAPQPWAVEADRVLEQSFFELQGKHNEYWANLAHDLDLSVWDLKRAVSAGEYPQQKAEYKKFQEAAILQVLNDRVPLAQKRLNTDHQNYERYYAHVVDGYRGDLTRWDVLDYAKLGAIILLLAILMHILAYKRLRKHWISYLYLAPPVIATVVFLIIPIIVSLYLSFTKYNPVMPLSEANWVGLDNYKLIFQDTQLWGSLWRSLYFTMVMLPVQLFIGVIMAACLDKNLWPDRIYKFVYFSPLVTSVVSVSLIWFALYAGTRYGWINSLLFNLDLTKDPVLFLQNKSTFLNSVIIMSIWQGLAFVILIFLAGLQGISRSLYEAAEIDGAGPIRQFFHISLPSLRPQLVFLVIMGTIGAIQVFEQIYMLGGGAGEAESKFGPEDSGMTMVPFLYRKGFEFFKMGEASAIAYVLFVILIVLTMINFKVILKKD